MIMTSLIPLLAKKKFQDKNLRQQKCTAESISDLSKKNFLS